jgi:SEC-C motif domain protein
MQALNWPSSRCMHLAEACLLYFLVISFMQNCPCNSTQLFSDCCGPVIQHRGAKTAEALMRSRYTAYGIKDIDYLIDSTHHQYRSSVDRSFIQKWADSAKWLGLEIIKLEKGTEADTEGTVEFIASYEDNGQVFKHHELGFFKKVKGAWYYYKGKLIPTAGLENKAPKTGRNDPCPCASGKKFKKCCA